MFFEPLIVKMLNGLSGRNHHRPPEGLVLGYGGEGADSPINWPHTSRDRHLCITGKTGVGKTYAMQGLACQLLARSEPFVLFDYHGDAVQQLIRQASTAPEVADRLIIVDPTDRLVSPGLNPLEVDPNGADAFGRSSELALILRQRWGVDSFGARTEELLRNTLYTLAASGQTLVEAPLLLTSPQFRAQMLRRFPTTDVHDYWGQRFDPLSEAMKATFREPLLNKITGFLTEPACRHFLGQTSTFTFTEAFARGQWVLINLAKGSLRDHAHTLGNLIFARLQFDILARSSQAAGDRRLVTVFVDEAQNLAENDLTTLLTEGRKFKVSLVTSHQYWDQMPREMRGALLSAGAHMFFQMSATDANTLAPEVSVSARHRYVHELTELRRGEAIVRIAAGHPYSIRVPNLPRVNSSVERLQAIRRTSLERYSRRRADIETEIQRRRQSVATSQTLQLTEQPTNATEGQQGW